jgi:hypothetical protein
MKPVTAGGTRSPAASTSSAIPLGLGSAPANLWGADAGSLFAHSKLARVTIIDPWEPYAGRLSRRVLREREGEVPSRHLPERGDREPGSRCESRALTGCQCPQSTDLPGRRLRS